MVGRRDSMMELKRTSQWADISYEPPDCPQFLRL